MAEDFGQDPSTEQQEFGEPVAAQAPAAKEFGDPVDQSQPAPAAQSQTQDFGEPVISHKDDFGEPVTHADAASEENPGLVKTLFGDFMSGVTGDKSWEVKDSPAKQAIEKMQNDIAKEQTAKPVPIDEAGKVLKDSAFSSLQMMNADLHQAVKGLHFDENDYNSTGNPFAVSRYVDHNGDPISKDDVESGAIPAGDVHEEPALDYFAPGWRGKPAPYFQSHEVNSVVSQAFAANDPTALEAFTSWWLGAKTQVTDPQRSGFYKYLLGPASEAEQGVARTTAFLLSKIDAMPPEDAKKMLSQEELHNHDIVDYYAEKVGNSGLTSRLGFGTTGFIADLMDPLMWVGTAQKVVRYGGEAVEYGGRMITDLGQMSKMEATHFKLGQDVEQIIRADGKMTGAATADAGHDFLQGTDGRTEMNLEALKSFQNSDAAKLPIAFSDMSEALNLSPLARDVLKATKDMRMAPADVMGEMARGERQLSLKIPFSNTALEVPFISDMMRDAGQSITGSYLDIKNGLGRTMESMNRTAAMAGPVSRGIVGAIQSAGDVGTAISSKIQTLASTTSRPFFDAAAGLFMNDQAYARYQASNFKNQWYKLFQGADGEIDKQALSEVFHLNDIEPQRSNDFYLSNIPQGTSYDAAVSKLTSARQTAQELRSTMSSNQIKLAEEIQKQNISMADAMTSRNLPFYELNPLEEENQTTGYMKHMFTKEYLSQYRDSTAAADAAVDFTKELNPAVDKSLLERKIKVPAKDLNDAYGAANDGMKMVIDDPIYAHTTRMKDMQDQLRKHDMLHTIDDYAIYKKANDVDIPKGFINFDPDKIGQPAMIYKDAANEPLKWFNQFMPSKMSSHLENGGRIYYPEDISTRLQYMLNPYGNGGALTGMIKGAFDNTQYFFKNSALFGTGYLGMRMASHAMTSLYSGTEIPKLFDALRVITPSIGEADKMFEVGGEMMSKSDVFDLAVKHGILKTGFMMDSDIDKVVENLGTSAAERSSIGATAKTVFDHAMGFSVNRAISAGIDDVGKLGHFLTQLDKGYTPAGAAESAAFWFYNYTQQTKAQNLMSAIIPFSSTGIKTMEQTLQSLKEMNVAHLTLPEKVNSVLSGNYIDSAEERRFLAENMPNWQKSNIMGPMLPGSHELVAEFPWVFHTMSAFWQPFVSERNDMSALPVNPLLKMLGTGLMAAKGQAQNDFGDPKSVKEATTELAASYLPPLFKHAITMYQLQHPEEDNSFIDFRQFYVPKGAFAPTKGNDTATMEKFHNAAEFGGWVEKEYGQNAFVNMWLFGSPEDRRGPPKDASEALYQQMYAEQDPGVSKREETIAAGLGNYVRSRMRDLTLGTFRATSLDTDFMSRNMALDRQSKDILDQIKTRDSKMSDALAAPGALLDPKIQENILQGADQEKKSLIAKHMALQEKMSALHQFYGSVVKDNQEKTGIYRQIFGTEPNRVQYTSQPHGLESLNSQQNSSDILGTMNEEQGE